MIKLLFITVVSSGAVDVDPTPVLVVGFGLIGVAVLAPRAASMYAFVFALACVIR